VTYIAAAEVAAETIVVETAVTAILVTESETITIADSVKNVTKYNI
jgi:hypothetical protein